MTCVCGATEGHKSQVRATAANEQWLHSSSASVQSPRWRAISEHNPACDRTADWVSRGVTAQGASWAVRFGTEFGLRPPILMNAARIRMRERGPAPAVLAWRPTCGTHIAVAKLCAHALAANAREATRRVPGSAAQNKSAASSRHLCVEHVGGGWRFSDGLLGLLLGGGCSRCISA